MAKKRIKYTPAQIGLMSAGAIRKAYGELKKIAVQRQKRLKAGGYGETELAQKSFIPARGASLEEVAQELAEVSLFLRDPRSMITKIRSQEKKIKETLKKHGYKIKDVRKFGDFMEAARSKISSIIYDSYRAAMLQAQAERHNISPASLNKNFEYFYNNLEALTVTLPIERENGKPVTAANLKQKMERAKWQEAANVYIEKHGEIWSN